MADQFCIVDRQILEFKRFLLTAHGCPWEQLLKTGWAVISHPSVFVTDRSFKECRNRRSPFNIFVESGFSCSARHFGASKRFFFFTDQLRVWRELPTTTSTSTKSLFCCRDRFAVFFRTTLYFFCLLFGSTSWNVRLKLFVPLFLSCCILLQP